MNYLDIARRTLKGLEDTPRVPNCPTPPLSFDDAPWADDPEHDESTEVIDPPDPCPECGTLELWQTLAGNWRCLRCDPPTKARRLRERAARLTPTADHDFNGQPGQDMTGVVADPVRQPAMPALRSTYHVAPTPPRHLHQHRNLWKAVEKERESSPNDPDEKSCR